MGDGAIYVSADDLREMEESVGRGVEWIRKRGGEPFSLFSYRLREDDFGRRPRVDFLLVKYGDGLFYESLERVELDGNPHQFLKIRVKGDQ